MEKINCTIVTPERIIFNKQVDQVIAPGSSGEFGILPDHVSFISILDTGAIKLLYDNTKEYFVISGGYLAFNENTTNILCDEVFTKENITEQEASSKLSELEAQLKNEKQYSDEYNRISKELEKYKHIVNVLFDGEK